MFYIHRSGTLFHQWKIDQIRSTTVENWDKMLSWLLEFFPKWSRTFAEFSEFRETDKSLKHELGSI